MEVIDIMAIIGIATSIVILFVHILTSIEKVITIIEKIKGLKRKGKQKKKPSPSRGRTRRRKR